MIRPHILVIDDKANMVKLFVRILEEQYLVTTAPDGTRALQILETRRFDLVLTDVRMPGPDGFDVLRAVKTRYPETEVVLITAFSSIPSAVEAIRRGAYDYLTKPFDPDDLLLILARALEKKLLLDQHRILRNQLAVAPNSHGLMGQSPGLKKIHAQIDQVAQSDITVMITGQSGTGKELVARAIHRTSARSSRPFVAVNSGALPTELVESELFGHAKGAFTGANLAKPGLFEEAQGGTIFFDEIGDLPIGIQVKLNRAVQELEIRHVGENRPMPIDVRIIAATHNNLKESVRRGLFREDLFYRLNVFPIELPPLRDRVEDIPLLAVHFLDKHTRPLGKTIKGFEPATLRALCGYPWPGNIRELENAIERAIAVCTDSMIGLAHLPPELQGCLPGKTPPDLMLQMPYREALDHAQDQASREYLRALLDEFGGNVTQAAERAKMERGSLHRLLKRFGIHSADFRSAEPDLDTEIEEA